MFVLHDVSAQTSSQEEAALRSALRPLIVNRDGHFVAAVTTMFQSLLEGKTDCPISGVFGAGKTLSAAAMIAGLLVMDPSLKILKIMIVTKENVAAHAFAKHFLRLGLPDSINSLVGRLVGYVELQKGPASETDLDIAPAVRNDVLRENKSLLGAVEDFTKSAHSPTARSLNGWGMRMWRSMMKGNNMATWMKPLLWRVLRANAWSFGVVTTNKPLVG